MSLAYAIPDVDHRCGDCNSVLATGGCCPDCDSDLLCAHCRTRPASVPFGDRRVCEPCHETYLDAAR